MVLKVDVISYVQSEEKPLAGTRMLLACMHVRLVLVFDGF